MGKSAEFAIDKAREVYEKHKDDHDTTEDDAYIVVSYRDVDKEAERVVDVVMTAFKEEDAGTLQDLFSEYISEQYDIAAQIKETFAFIDGEIVSTGDVLAGYSGGSTSALHGEVESLYDGTICEVTTDIGKEYTIQFVPTPKS